VPRKDRLDCLGRPPPTYHLLNRGNCERVHIAAPFLLTAEAAGTDADELLIFFAIGYLGTTIVNGAIHVIPIGMIDVSALLGIPKETVRRKTMRRVDLDYVETTPKGVFVKELKVWCQMLERAVS
jgi:hypothetical protein